MDSSGLIISWFVPEEEMPVSADGNEEETVTEKVVCEACSKIFRKKIAKNTPISAQSVKICLYPMKPII